ncbi:MAG: PKD domain-containing protein [Kiritimatiellae bacterium]|nr:PKD domain-containing protein [Kiritimatiellia bacterium]
MIATKKFLSVLFTGALAATAAATDYYVATTGSDDNDGLSAEAPFATIDKAISTATSADDVIHVEPGTYATTTQYGPNLKAKLIGTGTSRDDVVINADGAYRTLRMAANSWLENVTVVGNTDISKADKGGAIEMSGGTVTNCVIRDGTAYGNDSKNAGGNLYVNSDGALVVDCVISGGASKNRGGNVCLDHGTLRKCTITAGSIPEKKDSNAEQYGGNVFVYQGRIENCTITGGQSERAGNVYLYDASAVLADSTVSGGTGVNHGGNIFQRNGTVTNCVVSGGTASANAGGNIHIQNGSVLGSEVFNGTAKTSGGNVYMTGGAVLDTVISNGVSQGTSWDQGGGNVFMNPGRLTRCSISDGSADGDRGGGIRSRSASSIIEDCLVYGNANGGVCLEGKGAHYNNTIVNNGAYGIWGYGSNPGTFVNCVFYGNKESNDNLNEWKGNDPGADDLYNCAFGQNPIKGSVNISKWANCVYLSDDSAFVDYANGDYHIKAGSALQDAGASDSRADASALDLDGNPRTSGQVDIGCYEIQKSEMTVSFAYAAPLEHTYAPVTASFSVSAQNVPDGETPTFTINYGDGTEADVTTESTITHTYDQPGVYTITVTASAAGASDATMTYQDFVSLSSQTIYVTKDNASPVFPYDTPETGYATFAAALAAAVDGSEIRVGDGVYEQTAKHVVNKAVTILGNLGNPGAVVFRNTATAVSGQGDKRVMAIDNANALVCGLTLEGGQVYHGNGGNLTISAGAISNCVIRGGIAYAGTDAEYGMGAGVAISGSGVVSHCIITNNEVSGEASGKWVQGAAVVFPWGSSGKLLHSLVAHNRWVVDSETANGSAGVLYHGSTSGSRVESCTVVANEIVGTCGPSCAAGIRCDWNSVVRNTAIAGNRIGAAVSNVFLAQDGETWKDGLNNCVTEDALPSGNASCSTATVDEMFRDYASGDYRPKTKGALYDKGIDLLVAVSVDLAGEPRVFGKAIDIGCYESQMKGGFVIVVK